MKRKKEREYDKNRKSSKWKKMDVQYKLEVKKAKKKFYAEKIRSLANSKPKNWYRELKKLTGFDQERFEEVRVDAIKDLPAKEQVELIADKFASVSQEYEVLKNEDIIIPLFKDSDIPIISMEKGLKTLN